MTHLGPEKENVRVYPARAMSEMNVKHREEAFETRRNVCPI
jgi:hypothetical protein